MRYLLLAICVGCGAEDSNANPGSTGGASDERAFVPEGIEFESLDEGTGLQIEAATLHDLASGAEWLVSVRNTRKELVCDVDVAAVFSGQDGKDIDGQAVAIQGTPYKDFPEGCLASGEVGLGRHLISGKAAQVTHIMYKLEGLLPTDAAKVVDVGIESIRVVSSSASSGTARGRFRNDDSQTVINAAVYVFSLNAVGRPLAAQVVRNTNPLMPASAWAFEVSVPGPLEKYAAFAPFAWQWP